MSKAVTQGRRIGAFILVAGLLGAGPGWSMGLVVPGLLAGTRLHVDSIQALKFKDVVPQGTDYSCGSAAVATILRYAYGRPVDGQEVLRGMLAASDAQEVRKRGFSMLDMQRYVERLGYRGIGYHVPPTVLSTLKMPVIVLLSLHGYEHFVVLKRVDDGYAFVADPRLGNREIRLPEFVRDWNGVIFAIVGRDYDRSTPLRKGGVTRVRAVMPLVHEILGAPIGHFGVTPINQF
ncbi:C39 family peptidase [Acidihalobacter prosperus]|uniref:C39 family peptidase n=1 Tax=Acidihalobacter prosperus TaxID=160660 RepID=UPI0009ED5170|nr:C39 family peptidase [Acidihalobacter prosperus]